MAKKKAKKAGIHTEVHEIWGWVVLTIGIAAILGVAGYFYLMMF